MNRYPLWKYLVLAVALLIGIVYTLPNWFGEAPAVQISSARATVKVDVDTRERVSKILADAKIAADFVQLEGNSVRARFSDTDVQGKAKDILAKALNPDAAAPDHIVALNLVSRSPQWLANLRAFPMYLGLDLRGGVHFLLEVDMKAAIAKKTEALTGDVRTLLRDKSIRHAGVNKEGNRLTVAFRDAATLEAARGVLADKQTELQWTAAGSGSDLQLVGEFKPASLVAVQDAALKQNINTLHNRINELAVSEPVIQQQGLNRIVVQLPGVQDIAKAKDLLGRTATLEVRLVDDSAEAQAALAGSGPVPFGTERFIERGSRPLIVKRQVVLTGDNLSDAQAGFDDHQQPAVHLTLDSRGARIFKDLSRENIGKRMAILLVEKGKAEVLTAPVFRSEIGGGRVMISGSMTSVESTDTALLLRAGSLAAPMEIIEERTIGPSLGAENIARGFDSVKYGFLAVAAFMCVYYMLFGLFSSLALGFNLLMVVAVLSMLQATLSLPGMAAIALVLGMAIDSNVLINERIREELRNGANPQKAIHDGYEHAWDTILDSNVTTLIAGLALLAFGSGPIKGFAVVHCLGILTSMFSSVMFSRALVNLWYGRKRKLQSLAIGQVWRGQDKPEAEAQ